MKTFISCALLVGAVFLPGGAAMADSYVIRVPVVPVAHAPQSTTFNFGDVLVGSSPERMMVFQNRGSDPVTVTAVSTVGAARILSNTCAGATVAPGATCSVRTALDISDEGLAFGEARVQHSGATSADVLRLQANGVAADAALTFSPAYLDFGTVTRGTLSAVRTVTLTNEGVGEAWVLDVPVLTGSPAFRVVAHDCELLAPGDSCTVSLRFAPVTVGFQQGSAGAESDDGTVVGGLTLAGTGVQGEATLSPMQVNFLDLPPGVASEPQTVRLTNAGQGPLGFVRALVSGSTAFAVTTHNCPATLNPGAGCDISVRATLPDATVRAGVLDVQTTGGATVSVRADLYATPLLQRPRLELVPGSISFGDVGLSLSATRTLTLRSTGEVAATVSNFTVSGTHAGDYTVVNAES